MADVWIPWCYDPTPSEAIFAWIITIVSTIFVCTFGPYFVYLTWTKFRNISLITRIMQSYCTAVVIIYITTDILWSYHMATSFYCTFEFEEWLNWGLATLCLNQIGIPLLYLLFVFRLTYPFKGTVMAAPQLFIVILVIGFVLMLILNFIIMNYFGMFAVENANWEKAASIMIAFQATYFFFSVLLVSFFVKKLLLLSDVNLSQKAIQIIICASMGLLSSQLPSIISILRAYGDSGILWAFHVMLLAVDIAINLFSIYLQFVFGAKTYDKICGKLAKFCSKNVITISNLTELQTAPSNTNVQTNSSGDSITTNATTNSTVNASKIRTTSASTVTSMPTSTPDFVENAKTQDTIVSETPHVEISDHEVTNTSTI
eukprot:116040_1